MPRRTVLLGNGEVEADVAGEGPVTVVFESGLGSPLEVWDAVVPPVAERARTLRYDHRQASPTGTFPARSTSDLLADLDQLLAALAIPPPYVLIGHSWGGVLARLYASAHSSEVKGLVLVDGTHQAVDSGLLAVLPVVQSVVGVLCRAPFIRRAIIRQLCPPASSAAYRARVERRISDPKQRALGLRTSRAEGAAIRPALAQLKRDCPDLPPIPTHVLTAGGEKSKMARTNRAAWRATADRAGAPYTEISTSRHMLPIDAPEPVVKAILDALDMVAAGTTEIRHPSPP